MSLPSRPLQIPHLASDVYEAGPIITMASDEQLGRRKHVMRLAIAAVAEGFTRREWPDQLCDTIYSFCGTIKYPDGSVFEPTDTEIDDTFNDPDFRWISDFLAFADVAPRQRPQRRVIARLRLIDLYFRIKHPERARLIAE